MINKGMHPRVVLKEISLPPPSFLSPQQKFSPHCLLILRTQLYRKLTTPIRSTYSQYTLLLSLLSKQEESIALERGKITHSSKKSKGRCPAATGEGRPSSQFLEVCVTISHLAPESSLGRLREGSQGHSWRWRQKLLCDNCPLGHSLGSINIS